MRRPKVVRLQATVFDTDLDGVSYVDDAYTVYDSTDPAIKAGLEPVGEASLSLTSSG